MTNKVQGPAWASILERFLHVDRQLSYWFGGLILILMLVVLLATTAIFWHQQERESHRLMNLLSQVLTDSVSRVTFSGKYHARLMLESIQSNQPDIKYLRLVDGSGQILAHSDPKQNDRILDAETQTLIRQLMQEGDKAETAHRLLKNQGDYLIEVSMPYRGGYDQRVIGVLQIGLSVKAGRRALIEGLVVLVLLVSLLFLSAIFITRALSNRFSMPVRSLAEDMTATLIAIPDLMFELDREGRYLQVLASKPDQLAEPAEKLLGQRVMDVLPPEASAKVMDALAEAERDGQSSGQQFRLMVPEGDLWFELSVAQKARHLGKEPHFIVLSRNISDRKRDEARMQYLAHHDPLTGLLNRFSLKASLEQAISQAERDHEALAVAFIDLDHFKDINDSLGHRVGDGLLVEVAVRLEAVVRKSDMVARLGGDEFVVAMTGAGEKAQIEALIEKILPVLRRPYLVNGNRLHSGASIGVSMFPKDGKRVEQLMQCADTAMYQAKKSGRNGYCFFSQAMTQAAQTRLQLENDLRQALEKKQFSLQYQPQLYGNGTKLRGFEALIRWRHPELGWVPPTDFIPIAEDTGMIEEIGAWVLDEACRQRAQWGVQYPEAFCMSINLSVQQLRSPYLVDLVRSTLERHQLKAGDVELEITESMAMFDPQRSIEQMLGLHNLGVSLAVDDFGTGYSSLAYLKMLPIHCLKLDRVFVRDIQTDPNDAAISAATLALAHNLGLIVVAEGVETPEQCDFLLSRGCDVMQGYLFSKPEPPEIIEEKWLKGGIVSSG